MSILLRARIVVWKNQEWELEIQVPPWNVVGEEDTDDVSEEENFSVVVLLDIDPPTPPVTITNPLF